MFSLGPLLFCINKAVKKSMDARSSTMNDLIVIQYDDVENMLTTHQVLEIKIPLLYIAFI